MATYLMFGKYSQESIKAISAQRSKDAAKLAADNGGEIKGGYALMGETDLVLITEFPGIEQAMKASVELAKMLGISFSTAGAVTIEEFDKLVG